ncbi:MAG: glycoside hydrolase family 1 protein [Cyclobacteriaceae bacterium]|nr:glycoside hydrolase family 1 protein [Cyclobacteriaceae bacterium]
MTSKNSFPSDFIFGTSTAATQIETAFEHDWQGFKARDGQIFQRTTDHELRFEEDAEIIASTAPAYRMGLSWSKLQRAPKQKLDPQIVEEYRSFLIDLQRRNVKIMMVLHHFTNPLWFVELGGWENKNNIDLWIDFGTQVVETFGEYVSHWNTFNEPNVYVSYGWITGFFPPFKINPLKALKVIKNLGTAHDRMYDVIKSKFPLHPVGISHNAVVFDSENAIGHLSARLSDWWFMKYVPDFFKKADFFGMSYYARVSHDPLPITFLDTPDKIKHYNMPHDDIWEYHPEGLRKCLDRYWKKYKLPIIITENGVCDESDELRQQAIVDYAKIVLQAIEDGIDIRGYYWWSTWDNFEWHLGPDKKFGLYRCDPITKERTARASAAIYAELAFSKVIPETLLVKE